jgi:hypothetical protein
VSWFCPIAQLFGGQLGVYADMVASRLGAPPKLGSSLSETWDSVFSSLRSSRSSL